MPLKHTPGPWKVGISKDGAYKGKPVLIESTTHGEIMGPRQLGYPEDFNFEANAAHIVRCVNMFDELVSACEAAMEALASGLSPMSDTQLGLEKVARHFLVEAIAKAKL